MTDRVSLRAAGAGAIVAAGVGVVLLAAGAAVAPSLSSPEAMAVPYSFVTAALAALAGGYVAATGARTLTVRDGRLQGAIAGSLLVVAVALLAGTRFALFGHAIDTTAGAPIAGALAAIFLGSLLGGASGARAEARVAGIRRVRVPRTATNSYERDFFDAPLSNPSMPATASLSSHPA